MRYKKLKMKPVVKIKFQNGLTFKYFKRDVFDINKVSDYFEFIESDNPDFIVFGPYGNDLPPKGNYIRIGYFCENITPPLNICEWAFGIPREEEINSSRYKRIQWHDVSPHFLVKSEHQDIDVIINSKNKFCNFLYGHPVKYREAFFKELSKYKRVDSPGKALNNMPSIDSTFTGDIWERKRQFLKPYKFTIAFENYSYPGYQTEKLYDAMLTNSIPIYCGDPYIGKIFNTESFINAFDILKPNYSGLLQKFERVVQMNFNNYMPQHYTSITEKLIRKAKFKGRELKMKWEFNNLNYKALVDRIVEIDENENMYREMLLKPWFNNNIPPQFDSVTERWREIFEK